MTRLATSDFTIEVGASMRVLEWVLVAVFCAVRRGPSPVGKRSGQPRPRRQGRSHTKCRRRSCFGHKDGPHLAPIFSRSRPDTGSPEAKAAINIQGFRSGG